MVALGKPTGLYLTRPYTGVTETRNLTIQIPVGYNCTAYFDPLTKKWAWQRGQSWDTTKPGKRIFTMFWYQNHVNGWVETYANGGCWDWLFSQSKAAAGVPAITSQPKNATVAAGQTATFSATATGSGPLYYLWKRNGAAIAGATAASYTTAPLSLADSGTQFTLSVSNGSGSTTSTAAIVTVLAIQPSEPNLAINGWSNIPGKVEGTLRVRPVNTTSPRPPYGYLDYLPLGYNPANTMTKWPLIVHLPHITEAGDGTDSAANGNQLYNQLVKYGPLHLVVSQQWDFPAVIIAPQVVTNWTKPLNVKNVVEYAKANYRIDSNRIYMTGHLEGANGTLRYAVAYPGDLAGVLTIASTAVASTAQATLIRSLPLWATHSFADQTCPRSVSIGWIDALSSAQYGGTSDAMATYPGYGNRSHFAIDSNPLTRTPLNPDGEVITIAGARLATGSKTITFPSGVQFGSGIFAMWNGSDTQPFARVRVAGEAPFYVVAQGYASSLNLTAAYAGSATTASITIQTPVGYNATAYRNANGTWDWNRDLPWDQTRSDLRVLSLFWYQSATMGANQTWDNVSPWNWLLGQVKAPAGSG
ncbi:MAG TPA: hypothetical protein DCS97_00940 [Planctomycetes bacterium]|nr:hypothetical protein [Planctomycetota bacterium]